MAWAGAALKGPRMRLLVRSRLLLPTHPLDRSRAATAGPPAKPHPLCALPARWGSGSPSVVVPSSALPVSGLKNWPSRPPTLAACFSSWSCTAKGTCSKGWWPVMLQGTGGRGEEKRGGARRAAERGCALALRSQVVGFPSVPPPLLRRVLPVPPWPHKPCHPTNDKHSNQQQTGGAHEQRAHRER